MLSVATNRFQGIRAAKVLGPRSKEPACGRHVKRRLWSTNLRAGQSRRPTGASPSVARTCLAVRVSSPPPALLCALARHLCQLDRVGVLEGAQAVRRHPQRPSCRGFGRQPSQLDRESGLGNGSEGYSEGAIGVVDSFCDKSTGMRDRGCLEATCGELRAFFSSTRSRAFPVEARARFA
jgi:hypothetical protein